MKKALIVSFVAAVLVAGVVFAQTTVTNRGEVITVHTMTDLPKSTETNTDVTDKPWNVEVRNDATVKGDLAVEGSTTVSNVVASGTLAVTGVATFTAAPKLTAVTTNGSETATMTNAPAAGNPVAWANVSVGTNTYVIPLFAAE